ncbi:MAG: glycosyltransferase [Saprospiraceae bacterium]|nr:glycosyltransferase [Saprospiraceae bacterium]
MRIAVLSSRFPYPLERGDKLRLFHQIKSLSKQHEVWLYAINDKAVSPSDWEAMHHYCTHIEVFVPNFWDKLKGLMGALIYSWPFQSGIVFAHRFKKKLDASLQNNGIDVLYCQLIRMAPYCENIRLKKIIDYMDAFGRGMEKRAEISFFPMSWIYRWEARRVGRYEKYVLQFFDQATIITQHDRDILRLSKDADKLHVVANGIDTDYFKPGDQDEKSFQVGFVGNLGYLPNVDAIEFLCGYILPAYHAVYGQKLKVLLAGARPDPRVSQFADDHIYVSGWMEDIRKAYHSIQILVAPIFNGTGQQNKILEAMACGIPVITTREVALGISGLTQAEVCLAEDEPSFAHAIHRLLTDPQLRSNMANAARKRVLSAYQWDDQNSRLIELLDTKDLVY